jgi:hypothetical protein
MQQNDPELREKLEDQGISKIKIYRPTNKFFMHFPTGWFAKSRIVSIQPPKQYLEYLGRRTTNQSMPSLIPLPSIAEQATILQFRSRSSPNFNASEISPAPLAPGWSCLLAKTSRAASRSSSSFSMADSSSAAVPSRSISVESMTKTTAAVLA